MNPARLLGGDPKERLRIVLVVGRLGQNVGRAVSRITVRHDLGLGGTLDDFSLEWRSESKDPG